MRKFLAILLTAVILISCLSGCGGAPASSGDGSSSQSTPSGSSGSDTASSEETKEDLGGLDIPYSDVIVGFYQMDKWNHNLVNYSDYQTMGEEYLFLPAGTIIMCNERLYIYCYKVTNGEITPNLERSKELGFSVKPDGKLAGMSGCNVTLQNDCLVRFAVQGTLDDIGIFAPVDNSEEIVLRTPEKVAEDGLIIW